MIGKYVHRKGLFAGLLWVGCLGAAAQTVIRYNQIGYTPQAPKVVVVGSKEATFTLKAWRVVNVFSGKTVLQQNPALAKDYGAYGPFVHSYRISLSNLTQPGSYRLVVNDTLQSGLIRITPDAYAGAADFCLRYLRQQRCGFNPFLKDSCHTADGYSIYGQEAGIPDGTWFDATGGWHDASDYLQYTTTTANAVYHLLMAWRDYPQAFTDQKLANGLPGSNGSPDVLDEAKWGLDWLLKMHPRPNVMFAQLADDRDHISMRMPGLDSQYGRGFERPLYFLTGKPQGLGKYQNKTEGTTSIAAKFSSAFALGARVLYNKAGATGNYVSMLATRARTAANFAYRLPGFTNTAPNRAPYYYAEQNWVDDAALMETALIGVDGIEDALRRGRLRTAFAYVQQEKITPWLGADTAAHYQWYPFINLAHRELAITGILPKHMTDSLTTFYRLGIERVWAKARHNAFYRGVPFIWCSNNLSVAFAIQCLWYRQLTGQTTFYELEQGNIDWLFGCNPWGTSMVYGLPAWGDTPTDPHSAFTHLKHYPIDGGLVDGPVYTSIFKNLIGLTLYAPDEYAPWQSNLAVYHDDYGDYSTNEPTLDGTASLVYLLAALAPAQPAATGFEAPAHFTQSYGAITRADSTQPTLSLVFTAHEYANGIPAILAALKAAGTQGAFFLTGHFLSQYPQEVAAIKAAGHYIGPHSHAHLLYAPWQQRDSLLVTKQQFMADLLDNYKALERAGITRQQARWFLPPYEWYNDSISAWTRELGLVPVCHTPGTLSAADYTIPADANYRATNAIMESIKARAQQANGLNGYLLLTHAGVNPARPQPFYNQLPQLLKLLKQNGLQPVPLPRLLQ